MLDFWFFVCLIISAFIHERFQWNKFSCGAYDLRVKDIFKKEYRVNYQSYKSIFHSYWALDIVIGSWESFCRSHLESGVFWENVKLTSFRDLHNTIAYSCYWVLLPGMLGCVEGCKEKLCHGLNLGPRHLLKLRYSVLIIRWGNRLSFGEANLGIHLFSKYLWSGMCQNLLNHSERVVCKWKVAISAPWAFMNKQPFILLRLCKQDRGVWTGILLRYCLACS